MTPIKEIQKNFNQLLAHLKGKVTSQINNYQAEHSSVDASKKAVITFAKQYTEQSKRHHSKVESKTLQAKYIKSHTMEQRHSVKKSHISIRKEESHPSNTQNKIKRKHHLAKESQRISVACFQFKKNIKNEHLPILKSQYTHFIVM